MVVVGAVEPSGAFAQYSQGLANELTVSAVGAVWCAASDGLSTVQSQGTSFGKPPSMQKSLTSKDIGYGVSRSFCRRPCRIFHVTGSIQSTTFGSRICCEECERPHQVASICTAPQSTDGHLEWDRLATSSMSSSTRCHILRMSREHDNFTSWLWTNTRSISQGDSDFWLWLSTSQHGVKPVFYYCGAFQLQNFFRLQHRDGLVGHSFWHHNDLADGCL